MELPSSGDQYNLKWNNHLANFVQTFVEHQHGESLVDVTLSCEGQYIKTHKLILSACSDYFHSIFQVHASLQHPIIFLNGVKFEDLKYILHFMYHGEVKVVDKDLPNVLALGETLQIKGLSSVKLRDLPPEDVQTLPPPITKRNHRKEPSRKDQKRRKTPTLRAQKLVPLPSEVPQFVPVNISRNSFKSSRQESQQLMMPVKLPVQSPLPVITSVTSVAPEVTQPNTIVISESPPINGNSKNEESPILNNTGPPRETKTPIPKPPHAFMIFANEWRKKLTVEHPEENNKEISIRLGNMWKNLLPETKNIYYREAKRGEEEHKLKYPNYVSPSESLKRKADVLTDSTNTGSPTTSVDPMEIVEIQEQIALSDSD